MFESVYTFSLADFADDPDGHELTYSIDLTGATFDGEIEFDETTGEITFTPPNAIPEFPKFITQDPSDVVFTYEVEDDYQDTPASGQVTINITNHPPLAGTNYFKVRPILTGLEDQALDLFDESEKEGQIPWSPLTIHPIVNDNCSNPNEYEAFLCITDSDLPDWASGHFVIHDDHTDGTVEIVSENGVDTFVYTPREDFESVRDAIDQFSYQYYDGLQLSNAALVRIEVVNNAPVAQDDAYEVIHDRVLSTRRYRVGEGGLVDTGVQRNDYDFDGDMRGEFAPLLTILTRDVANGHLNLRPDGTFDYWPDPDSRAKIISSTGSRMVRSRAKSQRSRFK